MTKCIIIRYVFLSETSCTKSICLAKLFIHRMANKCIFIDNMELPCFYTETAEQGTHLMCHYKYDLSVFYDWDLLKKFSRISVSSFSPFDIFCIIGSKLH